MTSPLIYMRLYVVFYHYRRRRVACHAADRCCSATAQQNEHRLSQQQFAELILSTLPEEEGMTPGELQEFLGMRGVSQQRPALSSRRSCICIMRAWWQHGQPPWR
jgi:hypothetical protein